jgi:hypothetical protein
MKFEESVGGCQNYVRDTLISGFMMGKNIKKTQKKISLSATAQPQCISLFSISTHQSEIT